MPCLNFGKMLKFRFISRPQNYRTYLIQLMTIRTGNEEENIATNRIAVVENAAEKPRNCVYECPTGQELILSEQVQQKLKKLPKF